MNYSINIEPLYSGMDFCEKIKRVKAAGFDTIEFWGWNNKDVPKIKQTCEEHEVKISAFCAISEYSLCDREHARQAIDWVKKSMETAKFLECSRLTAYPNHFTDHGAANFRRYYSHDDMLASIVRNLTVLAPALEREKMTLLFEPLHNHGDDAGMSINTTAEGAAIIRAVDSPYVRLLCDFYHMQLMHGNLTVNILNNMDIVPYVHLSDAPDRFEPGTGEINYDFILSEMKKAGFDGVVCYEFTPSGDTEDALKQVKALSEKIG